MWLLSFVLCWCEDRRQVLSPVDIQDVKQSAVSQCHLHTYTHIPATPYIHSQVALLKMDPFLLTKEELRAGMAMGLPEGR